MMNTLAELFEDQIRDLYSAERQLTRALPKMARAASSEDLRDALTQHLQETEEHVRRLESLAESAGFKPSGKTCAGMKGLLEEGSEVIGEDGDPPIIDGAIIAAAQRVEHYEISGYGTARTLARLLGHEDAAELLNQTLEEESATDEKLTQVAERAVYPNVSAGGEEQEDESQSSGRGRSGSASGSGGGRRSTSRSHGRGSNGGGSSKSGTGSGSSSRRARSGGSRSRS